VSERASGAHALQLRDGLRWNSSSTAAPAAPAACKLYSDTARVATTQLGVASGCGQRNRANVVQVSRGSPRFVRHAESYVGVLELKVWVTLALTWSTFASLHPLHRLRALRSSLQLHSLLWLLPLHSSNPLESSTLLYCIRFSSPRFTPFSSPFSRGAHSSLASLPLPLRLSNSLEPSLLCNFTSTVFALLQLISHFPLSSAHFTPFSCLSHVIHVVHLTFFLPRALRL
jgi:hypothetical protein